MNNISINFNKLYQRHDIMLAYMGVITGIFVISLYYLIELNQRDIGLTIFSSSLIYLLIHNKLSKNSAPYFQLSTNEKLLLNGLFFILLFSTLYIWWSQLYQRPFIYFVLISILVSIIAIEIFYMDESSSASHILIKILLLSVSFRVGLFYNYPSLMGYDAYTHAELAKFIVSSGFIPSIEISGKYFYYPIFHIFISIIQIVSDLVIKDSIFNSIGMSSIFSTVFIYLVCMKINTGKRVALLSTLLLNFINFIIVRGIANITPGSLVICYSLILLYIFFVKEKSPSLILLMIFLTFLMIITHQLSTFVIFIIVLSFMISKYLHLRTISDSNSIVNASYVILFAVSLQFYWMNSYTSSGASFFDIVLGPLIGVLKAGGGEYGSNVLVVGQTYSYTLLETSLIHLSYLIIPFFGIAGIFLWASSKESNKFSIAIVTIVLYVFIYGIPLLGIRNMLTSRWQPFISLFLAILVAAYLVKIISLIKLKSIRIFSIFILIFIISFFMITTPAINKDNSLIAKDTTIRNQFEYNEIFGAKAIGQMSTGNIYVDTSYCNSF